VRPEPAPSVCTPRDPRGAANIDAAVKLIRAAGLRMTAPRRLLLRCLYASAAHRTADELVAELRRVADDINLSTIYRNLAEFQRVGIIGVLELGHSPARYYVLGDGHAHVQCDRCEEVFDIPRTLFDPLRSYAATSLDVDIGESQLAIRGRCPRCRGE
jgi:Fe2+ or Zn2+ uptake regulation protein